MQGRRREEKLSKEILRPSRSNARSALSVKDVDQIL
jgi:hypothetical protein